MKLVISKEFSFWYVLCVVSYFPYDFPDCGCITADTFHKFSDSYFFNMATPCGVYKLLSVFQLVPSPQQRSWVLAELFVSPFVEPGVIKSPSLILWLTKDENFIQLILN